MRLSKKDQIGILIWVGIFSLGILGLFVSYAVNREARLAIAAVDPLTLCKYGELHAHTVILVDKTDPFSDNQSATFSRIVREVSKQLVPGEKLSIFLLDDKNYRAPVSSFALCRPARGVDAHPITENEKFVERSFQAKFGKPLDQLTKQIQIATSASESPILEMIHAVSLTYDFGPSVAKKRLIIFSDLMQNSSNSKHYGGKFDYEGFRTTEFAKAIKPRLTGVTVEVIYLLRANDYAVQSQAHHQRFWAKWLQEAGVSSIARFERVG